jgi:hypothetical protein
MPTCSKPCLRSSSDILTSRCCAATAAGSRSYSLSTFASDKMIGSVTRTSCKEGIPLQTAVNCIDIWQEDDPRMSDMPQLMHTHLVPCLLERLHQLDYAYRVQSADSLRLGLQASCSDDALTLHGDVESMSDSAPGCFSRVRLAASLRRWTDSAQCLLQAAAATTARQHGRGQRCGNSRSRCEGAHLRHSSRKLSQVSAPWRMSSGGRLSRNHTLTRALAAPSRLQRAVWIFHRHPGPALATWAPTV